MKVGDLVSLSTYGKDRKRADWIDRDDVGVVIKVKTYDQPYHDEYIVKWCKSDFETMRATANYSERWRWEKQNHRKDLKYIK